MTGTKCGPNKNDVTLKDDTYLTAGLPQSTRNTKLNIHSSEIRAFENLIFN